MINLWLNGHDFRYEAEKICQIFFPLEELRTVTEKPESGEYIESFMRRGESEITLGAYAEIDGKQESAAETAQPGTNENELEIAMAAAIYRVLQKITGYSPAWGIVTGVRPAKLLHSLCAQEGSEQGACDYFKNSLFVSDEKTSLTRQVMRAQAPIYKMSRPESFSLYVSIPFCPTRCSYCSFVSHSLESAKKLLPDYVRLLTKELEKLGDIARELGLRLETVYFGGGTPTTLSGGQLLQVARAIEENFDLSFLREYTIEAGRPDTITPERLDAMREIGVTRISINPQTLNDDVLNHIGRKHTAQQTIDAFNTARKHGFSNINMDLIAGLPTDTLPSFRSTLQRVLELMPESITVHTLALKRSSRLVTQGEDEVEMRTALTGKMLDEVTVRLPNAGFKPYYMYRQSRCVGNLENVGWCRDGFESLYNVFMMEEIHTVLAAGAGAVTRFRQPGGNRIERIFNYKYPFEYIRDFDEMLRRKDKITELYEKIL